MYQRTIGGIVYTLSYDPEGHMIGYSGGIITNRYIYDGDGNLVVSIENNLRIIKLSAFEIRWDTTLNCNPAGSNGTGNFNSTAIVAPPTNCTYKTYYGSFAVRNQGGADAGTHYLLQDNLSSNTEIIEPNLTFLHKRFNVWGESDTNTAHSSTVASPTDNQYTGQDRSSNSGLYFYQSRWYDPYIMRWIQPDTVIPDKYNPLDLDRYQYVRSNPVNLNDPSGHIACWDEHANDPGCSGKMPTSSGLQSKIILTWPDLNKNSQQNLLDSAINQWNFEQHKEAPAVDIAGTAEDPVVWLVGLISLGRIRTSAYSFIQQLINAGGTTYLYRAVSSGEASDILKNNAFRPDPNNMSMEGKWFTNSVDLATKWGQIFQNWSGKPFNVIEVGVPQTVVNQMLFNPNLDGIGPAWYADGSFLDKLNLLLKYIKVIK